MLTRLEVDGFKNLRQVATDFGPHTCIAGPNGVGKSNLFDAIEFLSLLARFPLMEAAQHIRRSDSDTAGDVRDLFWTDGRQRVSEMRFGVEMTVPRNVRDAFGREAEASITFLRYELTLGYRAPSDLDVEGHLVLRHESLRHINRKDAHDHLRFPHRKATFRDAIVLGSRRGGAFISTITDDDGRLVTRVHADGSRRGPARPSPTENAPMTVVGTTTLASDPTILAAKREFESWRMLALEPSAMRAPDDFQSPAILGVRGDHLAATLYRLATRKKGQPPDPEQVYSRVARRLGDLVPVDALRVDRDDTRRLLTLMLRLRRGPELAAKSLSDGTLRFLALCLIEADSDATGLLCMEEPENGVHPARLGAMVELVRDLAVDPMDQPGPDNPLRQVIVNTHSPQFVEYQRPEDRLLAVEETRRIKGIPTRVTQFRPQAQTWRCSDNEIGVPRVMFLDYLEHRPLRLTAGEGAR